MLWALSGCAPRSAGPPPRKPQGITHVVRPGENLYRIGRAYDVSHEALARLNGIREPSQLRAGQRIFIPGATRQLPVDIIAPAEPSTEAPSPTEPAEPGVEKYLWPVDGTVNSGFGARGTSYHDGVDIAAPEGTPIRAIEKGEVIYSDQLKGYGNIVIVRHADGIVSVYAHNEHNRVREGDKVSRGDVVATVGSTGRVTGPHLHFEIRKNNAPQDPARYFPRLCCVAASVMVSPKD